MRKSPWCLLYSESRNAPTVLKEELNKACRTSTEKPLPWRCSLIVESIFSPRSKEIRKDIWELKGRIKQAVHKSKEIKMGSEPDTNILESVLRLESFANNGNDIQLK